MQLQDIQKQEFYLHNKYLVYVSHHLPFTVKVEEVIARIENVIPENLLEETLDIFIGNFDKLHSKQLKSLYHDGAIYVSNELESEEILFYHIICALSYCVEHNNKDIIYADGLLEKEFLEKRLRVYNMYAKEVQAKKLNIQDFMNIYYDKNLENLMLSILHRSKKGISIYDVFPSAFGFVSLKQYFIDCFVEYTMKMVEKEKLKHLTPIAYKKINQLLSLGKKDDDTNLFSFFK
jgi:hypothetical protein